MQAAVLPEQPLTRADARAMRAQMRHDERKREVRQAWDNTLARTRALMGEAHALLKSDACPGLRELWLVVGVFEYEEHHKLKGEAVSARTAIFDCIAPRARAGYRGVSGFSARAAAKYPQVLRGSGNGYVYLTDLGYALTQLLRQRNPDLRDIQVTSSALPLQDIGDLPAPRWRSWF